MLKLNLSDQQFYCLLRCNLYYRFEVNILCKWSLSDGCHRNTHFTIAGSHSNIYDYAYIDYQQWLASIQQQILLQHFSLHHLLLFIMQNYLKASNIYMYIRCLPGIFLSFANDRNIYAARGWLLYGDIHIRKPNPSGVPNIRKILTAICFWHN